MTPTFLPATILPLLLVVPLAVPLSSCATSETLRRIEELEAHSRVLTQTTKAAEDALAVARSDLERLKLAGSDTAEVEARIAALVATLDAARANLKASEDELAAARTSATDERITSGITIGDTVASIVAPILSILFPVVAPLAGLIQQVLAALAAARRKETPAHA